MTTQPSGCTCEYPYPAEVWQGHHPNCDLVRPGSSDERPRRYDQCDDTCTVVCGHCKGSGRPSSSGVAAVPLVDEIARMLDVWDTDGSGRWDDPHPTGWQSQQALRDAYRHDAEQIISLVRDRVADEILSYDKDMEQIADESRFIAGLIGINDDVRLGMRTAARVARDGAQ